MKTWLPSVLFLGSLLFQVVAYELWAAYTSKVWTISHTLYEASQQWPLIVPLTAFVLGILVGHLFSVKT